MSAPTWTPPYWSQPPSQAHQWNLLEIKQGNLISSHSLNELASNRSGCVTFGRMDDSSLVDVVTAHESCSRLHARLAFDHSGNAWLRDLRANNGTFVNNRRLPPEACGKLEVGKGAKEDGARGSRGVMVYPGDVFKFGASTRIYCLEGPEEFDREAKQKQQMANTAHTNSTGNTDSEKDTKECSWGIGPDDDPSQEEPESARAADPNLPSIETFFSPSSTYTIPSSLQQLHKTYQTKQYKLQAIQLETSRIVQKEDRGAELTDGQTKQVEKNRERIETLEKELDDLTIRIEEGIYGVIHGVQISLKKKRKVHSESADDDVDDFYDKTAQQEKKQRTNNDEAESEQDLIQKWKTLYKSHEKQSEVVSRAERKSLEIQREISSMEDEEESFFLRNDLTLANEDLSKAKTSLNDIIEEWTETEYLLKIVNPKLTWDRDTNWIGMEGENITEKNMANQSDNHNETNHAAEPDESIMIPPPPMIPTSQQDSLTCPDAEHISSASMPPPSIPVKAAASTQIKGPAMPPPPSVSPQTNPASEKPISATKKRQIGPSRPTAMGTLAALQQAANSQPTKSSNKSQHHTNNQNTLAPEFDPRKDEWSAPKDQDGSGRTSLHEKFKGRY